MRDLAPLVAARLHEVDLMPAGLGRESESGWLNFNRLRALSGDGAIFGASRSSLTSWLEALRPALGAPAGLCRRARAAPAVDVVLRSLCGGAASPFWEAVVGVRRVQAFSPVAVAQSRSRRAPGNPWANRRSCEVFGVDRPRNNYGREHFGSSTARNARYRLYTIAASP